MVERAASSWNSVQYVDSHDPPTLLKHDRVDVECCVKGADVAQADRHGLGAQGVKPPCRLGELDEERHGFSLVVDGATEWLESHKEHHANLAARVEFRNEAASSSAAGQVPIDTAMLFGRNSKI